MKTILIASARKKIAKCLAFMICLAAANMAYAASDTATHNQRIADVTSGIDIISGSVDVDPLSAETPLITPNDTDIAHSSISNDMVDMGDNVQIIGEIITGGNHRNHPSPAPSAAQRHNIADQAGRAASMDIALTTSNRSIFNALVQFAEWETSNLIDSMQLSLVSDLILGNHDTQTH